MKLNKQKLHRSLLTSYLFFLLGYVMGGFYTRNLTNLNYWLFGLCSATLYLIIKLLLRDLRK
jgi:hypothetical protein